jgi:hypothetical protein
MPNRKLDPDDFPLVTDFKEGEQSRRVEWHVGGVPVQVRIDRDVPINVQVQAAEALNSFPESFVRAAGSEYSSLNLRLVPEIVIGRGVKMAGLESGWKAGGLFTSGFNTVTLPANFGGLDFQRVLAHELGHGMQYNSMPSFSQRNVAAAYTADRKQIERDRYSPGIKSTAYSEFSYFRQSSKEMHAEMVAAHTLISMGAAGRYVDRGKLERARRYRDAHPHMFEVVNTGLHRINKKRQRA